MIQLSPVSLRLQIAEKIFSFEARRTRRGDLAVYYLPSSDGGGAFEVAGINVRYHPTTAKELKKLIEAGLHEQAEEKAVAYIATYTDPVQSNGWTQVPAIAAFLRDAFFNRGPTGSLRIYQRALGVSDDGAWGPITQAAAEDANKNPIALLAKLRQARQSYERLVVGRHPGHPFWEGLVNRWNKITAFARSLLEEEAPNLDTSNLIPAALPLTQGERVRIAQVYLASKGHDIGNSGEENNGVDGYWGPLSEAAAIDYLIKQARLEGQTVETLLNPPTLGYAPQLASTLTTEAIEDEPGENRALLDPASLSLEEQLERFLDSLGLQYFKGAEFSPYWSRTRGSISNSVPPRKDWANIAPTLALLERLRHEIGSPIHLTSTYRNAAYNRAVGGVAKSQHLQFRAIDFYASTGRPQDWSRRLESYRGQVFLDSATGKPFIFNGFVRAYPPRGFVHVDTRNSRSV